MATPSLSAVVPSEFTTSPNSKSIILIFSISSTPNISLLGFGMAKAVSWFSSCVLNMGNGFTFCNVTPVCPASFVTASVEIIPPVVVKYTAVPTSTGLLYLSPKMAETPISCGLKKHTL